MRSKNTRSVTTYITDEEYDAINEFADGDMISKTEWIRLAIKDKMKKRLVRGKLPSAFYSFLKEYAMTLPLNIRFELMDYAYNLEDGCFNLFRNFETFTIEELPDTFVKAIWLQINDYFDPNPGYQMCHIDEAMKYMSSKKQCLKEMENFMNYHWEFFNPGYLDELKES